MKAIKTLSVNFLFLFIIVSCLSKNDKIEMQKKSQAAKELNYIILVVSAYMDAKGHPPEKIYDAAESWGEIPRSWNHSKEAIDPWGSKYLIKIDDMKIFTYSIGPNKIDESGSGDDIFREINYP